MSASPQLRMLLSVKRLRDAHPQLREISVELDGLTEFVAAAIETNDAKSEDLRRSVVALTYLRNPYDHIF